MLHVSGDHVPLIIKSFRFTYTLYLDLFGLRKSLICSKIGGSKSTIVKV